MAPTRQGDASGLGRHGRQTADHGGPQVQHPQVRSGGVRPRHDPPEPGQPQQWLCGLQLPVEGMCMPEANHYAFLPDCQSKHEESVGHNQTTNVNTTAAFALALPLETLSFRGEGTGPLGPALLQPTISWEC